MPYHYTDASRENDPHALSDVETFCADTLDCAACGTPAFRDAFVDSAPCADCGELLRGGVNPRVAWYWHNGFPGCLPDSDPSGPYASEAEALTAAREAAGLCPHGVGDDDACAPCDAKAGA